MGENSNSVQEWTFSDRADWQPGPWDSEPDKILWVDEETGLQCMIHRNGIGGLCGYVGVPKGHPLNGVEYEQAPAIDVHGGLTFSAGCGKLRPDGSGICHPTDGEDHLWWFGFDCVHLGDAYPSQRFMGSDTYKDVPWVKAETQRLAKQLVAQ